MSTSLFYSYLKYFIMGSALMCSTQACATSNTKKPAFSIMSDVSIGSQFTQNKSSYGAAALSASPAFTSDEKSIKGSVHPTASTQTRTRTRSAASTSINASKDLSKSTTPMLIYVGSISLRVDGAKISELIDQIILESEMLGGHLMRRTHETVTVKVPSPRFREAISKIETFAEVTEQSISAQDVTEEYLDLEVRLQNLRATRERLQEFLRQSKNVQDALSVEREFERVAQEIDRIEGRLQYLHSHVAFSELRITVESKPKNIVVESLKPPARIVNLPISWLNDIELSSLLNLFR